MPRPTRRQLSTVLTALACTGLLTACFTSTADFKSDAESFIRGDVAEALSADEPAPVVFTMVTCIEPVDREIGTRFRCDAVDSNGGNWEFDNEIVDDNEFVVNVSRRP